MNLITETLRAQLLANGQQSLDNDNFDPPPVVKLFTPDASATWLLTEIDPDDHDHAFGLCDLGQGFPELGYGNSPGNTVLDEVGDQSLIWSSRS